MEREAAMAPSASSERYAFSIDRHMSPKPIRPTIDFHLAGFAADQAGVYGQRALAGEPVFADWPAEGWIWCSHCERCYKIGEFRMVDGQQFCPYEGCDGDTHLDAWGWFNYRYGQGVPVPEKAELPERGRIYGVGTFYSDVPG